MYPYGRNDGYGLFVLPSSEWWLPLPEAFLGLCSKGEARHPFLHKTEMTTAPYSMKDLIRRQQMSLSLQLQLFQHHIPLRRRLHHRQKVRQPQPYQLLWQRLPHQQLHLPTYNRRAHPTDLRCVHHSHLLPNHPQSHLFPCNQLWRRLP